MRKREPTEPGKELKEHERYPTRSLARTLSIIRCSRASRSAAKAARQWTPGQSAMPLVRQCSLLADSESIGYLSK
jgi:hypothetical protein